MKLYIARHGQTELNQKKVLQGNIDSPLTERGVQGAEQLRDALKEVEIDLVITSTLGRAVRTTEIIVEGRNQEIVKSATIGEMTFGAWQGKTQAEICVTKEEEERYTNYFRHPEKYVPVEGGESYQSMMQRAEEFLQEMAAYEKEHQSANVLLVSHGAFIKALLTVIKGHDIKDYWAEPAVVNCSLSIVEIKNGGYNILVESDIDHLGEERVPVAYSGYLKSSV